MIGIILTVVFLALKLAGLVDWSWWWLVLPIIAAALGVRGHYENRAWRGF